MSIIRQRRKNLILSGVFGLLLGALFFTVSAYLFRQPLVEWLDLTASEAVIEPVLVPSIVTARNIEKGTVLEVDDLMTIMVEDKDRVRAYFATTEEVLGKKTLIDLDQYMPITPPMFLEDSLIDNHLRLYEVSFVELPYHLSVGDVVDVRIAFPTGQEYVVLSKKAVVGFERRAQNVHSGLLNMALEEEEALRMSSALVDRYIAEGARVYMVKYVDPDKQTAAVVNYPVNESVYKLLVDNPNILELTTSESIIRERSVLNQSLVALLDEDHQPVYQVDMSTPDLSMNQAEDEPIKEEEEDPSETKAPTSDSSSRDNKAGGIGF